MSCYECRHIAEQVETLRKGAFPSDAMTGTRAIERVVALAATLLICDKDQQSNRLALIESFCKMGRDAIASRQFGDDEISAMTLQRLSVVIGNLLFQKQNRADLEPIYDPETDSNVWKYPTQETRIGITHTSRLAAQSRDSFRVPGGQWRT